MATAAGIRKFTGFIAADGSTHDTMKKAVQYANDQKVKEALNAQFSEVDSETAGAHDVEGQYYAIGADGLATFLFANRAAIQAAFDSKVTVRKPRTTKAKPASNDSLIATR